MWAKLWRNIRAAAAEWLIGRAVDVAPEPYDLDLVLAILPVMNKYIFADDDWSDVKGLQNENEPP